MTRYDLVFSGELIEGCDPAQVRRDLERLFRADANAVARLFTGKPVVIKRDLDEQAARRYRAALQQVGALCRLHPSAAEPAPTERPAPARSAGALAGTEILPPGSILTEPQTIHPPDFDLSAFSIAPTGVTLVEHETPVVVAPAPGAFDVAPAGADLVDPRPVAPAPIPDISALSMAPPRTEVLTPEERAKPAPPPPAVPDLKLAD